MRMKLYSHIVTHDTGFSPNPFWGYCTLADCKPAIRRTASVGDWIVGLSPKAHGNQLIYAMRVNEVLPYEQYYRDKRFSPKIPDYSNGKVVHQCGDNIYKPLSNGDFRQLQSRHSNGTKENPGTKAHDLRGKNVLVAKTFYYFGVKALRLPKTLDDLKAGRAYKNSFSSAVVSGFIKFITRQRAGVNSPPTVWPREDASWKTVAP